VSVRLILPSPAKTGESEGSNMTDGKTQAQATSTAPAKQRKRASNANLALAKRRIDEALIALAENADLRKQCEALRNAVLDAWIASERKLPGQAA
jgi:uncharacterized protein YhaN